MKRVYLRLPFLVLLALVLMFPGRAGAAVTSGDIVKFTGSIAIEKDDTVNGNVVAMSGNIEVAGRVNGDITAMAGNISLKSTAYVTGNVVTMAGSIYEEEGATVLGNRTQLARGGVASIVPPLPPVPTVPPAPGTGGIVKGPGIGRVHNPVAPVTRWFGWMIGMAAVSALMLTLFPRPVEQMVNALSHEPGRILATGLVGWVLYPVALLVVVLTIIGIPLAVLGVVMVPVVVAVGIVVAAMPVGHRVRDMFGGSHTWAREDRPLLDALIGIGVLMLATAAPLVGWLVWPVAAVIGLGVVLVTRFGTNRPWFASRRGAEVTAAAVGTAENQQAIPPAANPEPEYQEEQGVPPVVSE